MARGGKSVITSAPKQPKETRAEKEKRLENYRIAKAQAKKFVVPGIIAILACVFFLFTSKYGLKGTKSDPASSPAKKDGILGDLFGDKDIDSIIRNAAKEATLDLSSAEARDELTKQLTEAFLKHAQGMAKGELEDVFAAGGQKQEQEQEQEQGQEPVEEVKLEEDKEAAELPNEPKPEVVADQQ